MATRLTKKEKTFVKSYAVTGNGTQSALVAYDTKSYSTAGVIAHDNLKKPKIISALEEALPDELLAKVHREGLFSTRPIYDKDNNLIGEDADFAVRHKYLDTAYKLKGSYAAEKSIVVNVEVEASPEVVEATKVINEHFRNSVTSNGGSAGVVGTQAQDKD